MYIVKFGNLPHILASSKLFKINQAMNKKVLHKVAVYIISDKRVPRLNSHQRFYNQIFVDEEYSHKTTI